MSRPVSDAAATAAAAQARAEAAERARQEAAARAQREAEQQALREAPAQQPNQNSPFATNLFAERNGLDPTFARSHFQFRFANQNPPTPAPPDPSTEANALITRHTDGDGDINTDGLGRELAQTVVRDPARTQPVHGAVIDRMSDGDRDEVAQSFADALNDDQLRGLAATPEGRAVLTKTEGALLGGSVHDDERQSADRIYRGLGRGLAQLAAENPTAARTAVETTMDGLSGDGRDEVAQVFSESLGDDQLGRLVSTPDGQASVQRVKRELLAGDVHDDERRQGDRLQNAQVTPTFAQYLELRGDAGRELRGADLINEIGVAMNMMPNNAPRNADQEARLNNGTWEFYAGAEREAINPVADAIRNVGGENPRVTVLPVMLDSAETGLVQVPLFRVQAADGGERFVDNIGRTYDNFGDWKDNNKLPAGRISYAADGHLTPGADGRPVIVTENSHAVKDTFWEHAKPWVDGAALVGGVVVAGALIVGTGGAATPFVVGAGAAISAYGASQAGAELIDRHQHGQTLSPLDADARSAWIGLGSNVVGMAALGASARLAAAGSRGMTASNSAVNLARGLNVAAQYTDTAAIADLGYDLAANWDRMTPQQRMMAVGQMAFWSGMMGYNARQAGGVRNLYGAQDINNFMARTRQQDRISSEDGQPTPAAPTAPARGTQTTPPPDGVSRSTPEARQQFRELFGESRYNDYAREIEDAMAAHPELQNIPTEDLVAIRGYTSDDYRELNGALRGGDAAELQRLDPYIRCATSGLNQLPSFEGVVYRGTDLTPEQAAQYVPGEVRVEPSFFSTSAEAAAAFPGNTEFVIRSARGRDVSVMSEFPGEREILFPPGTQFKVLSVDIDPATNLRTINMIEVAGGGQ